MQLGRLCNSRSNPAMLRRSSTQASEPSEPHVERIAPKKLAPISAYAQVAVANNVSSLVFVAGQTTREGDLEDQACKVFDNVAIALRASGATVDKTVKITVFVKDYDVSKRSIVRENVQRVFGRDALPASSLVGVSELADPESLIEVEAIAVK